MFVSGMTVSLPVFVVFAAAFLSSILTYEVKPFIARRFKEGAPAHDVALRAFNGATAIVAAVVAYVAATPQPTAEGILEYVVWGLVATLASIAHFHIAQAAHGQITILPDLAPAATDVPSIVIPSAQVPPRPTEAPAITVASAPIPASSATIITSVPAASVRAPSPDAPAVK